MKRRNFITGITAAAAAAATAIGAAANPPRESEVSKEETKQKPNPPAGCLDGCREDYPKAMRDLMDKCARYQTHAHNGGFVSHYDTPQDNRHWADYPEVPSKMRWYHIWEARANDVAAEIEELANALGYETIWPGMYPEFTKIVPGI